MLCELMSKKLNAIISDETWQALEEIAKQEQRTKSQMAAILLAEAIANRQRQKQPDANLEVSKG
jgi:predicted transcriptional regulator